MGAGGLWMPFHCNDSRTDGWSFATLRELLRRSKNNTHYEEILPAIAFKRKQASSPSWATLLDASHEDIKNVLQFKNLTIDELYEESKLKKFRLPAKNTMVEAGYTHAWLFQTPVIDCPKMLMHMLEEIKASPYADDIDVETNKYYKSVEEMVQHAIELGCDALVNCTGLGAQEVCKDTSLIGARGILLHYNRRSCVWNQSTNEVRDSVVLIEDEPFGSCTHPCYMIPRGELIVVGGSYLERDEQKHIRNFEREQLITNAGIMGINTDQTNPIGEWVGFRPVIRSSARLEIDEGLSTNGLKVVHSYGYGGSGWTVFIGAANEAISLILNTINTK